MFPWYLYHKIVSPMVWDCIINFMNKEMICLKPTKVILKCILKTKMWYFQMLCIRLTLRANFHFNMVEVKSEFGWQLINLSNAAGKKVKASIIIYWWLFESGANFKVNVPYGKHTRKFWIHSISELLKQITANLDKTCRCWYWCKIFQHKNVVRLSFEMR